MGSPAPGTVALTDRDVVDVKALGAWLLARGIGDGAVDVTRFPSGHSNLTYLVQTAGRSVVLRAPPPGAATIGGAGHDVVREQRILSRLKPVYAKVPATLGFQETAEGSPLGVPFYLMERVEGRVLRHRKPKDIELPPATMQALTEGFVDELATLHKVDVAAAGLADLGKPEGYVQRQVDGWRGRYDKARTDEISDLERTSIWLKDNVPSTSSGPPTLVHNDFKLDNLVLADDDVTRIVAVLDWELCTIGEPLTDLGTSLAYWVEDGDGDDVKALPMGLTWLPGCLTRAQIVSRWEERSGREAEHLLFYYVLATFKVATIAQQIYSRYVKGFTKDERFALLGFATAVIGARAAKALDAGKI
ncbi:MAG: phosphotransferase family protein [Deltaproteobacteria bacterium]|nr:phosphotransferase family protein [Deltaproteobacteria bacterium]